MIRRRDQGEDIREDHPLPKGIEVQSLAALTRVLKDSDQLDDVYQQVAARVEKV